MSYSSIKMCMCVDMYMVANLILLCSLEHISLVETLKHFSFARSHGLSYSFFSFFRHQSTHCFKYLGHLSIFSLLFLLFAFMNNSCIAHASFSIIGTFQERHLQELGAFILSNIFLCLFPV